MATSRTVDWVQHDVQSDGWSWRQRHPESGFADRRLNHEIEGEARYTKTQQNSLKKAFKPLVKVLVDEYDAIWWHYSHSSRQLFFEDSAGKQEIRQKSVLALAEAGIKAFTTTLTKLHGHRIVPGRS